MLCKTYFLLMEAPAYPVKLIRDGSKYSCCMRHLATEICCIFQNMGNQNQSTAYLSYDQSGHGLSALKKNSGAPFRKRPQFTAVVLIIKNLQLYQAATDKHTVPLPAPVSEWYESIQWYRCQSGAKDRKR